MINVRIISIDSGKTSHVGLVRPENINSLVSLIKSHEIYDEDEDPFYGNVSTQITMEDKVYFDIFVTPR